jgi:hypothetical protein
MPIRFFAGGIAPVSKKHMGAAFELVDGLGVMFSMHERYLSAGEDWLKRHHDRFNLGQTEAMFDSGAYTARNADHPSLKASELARLYERAARWCEGKLKAAWFVNLDEMPKRDASPEEIDEATRQSDRNRAELIRAVPERILLPVLHRCESLARLREVQDQNPSYLCLSPLVGTGEDIRIKWSVRMAAHIKARNPNTQLHGLATTADRIMREVNWRSVDSAAWALNAGKFAVIFVEHDDRILRIPIGRQGGPSHFDSIEDKRLRARVEQSVAERGFDLAAMRGDPGLRQLFNLRTMVEFGRRPKGDGCAG